MDGWVGAIKRFSIGTNYSKWSPQFTKLVDSVSQPRIGFVTRVGYVNKLDPWISCPCFTNSKDSEMLKGKRDLLRLWEYMIEFVTFAPETRYKELGYNVIVTIVQRKEFRLGQIGFGPTSSKPTCTDEHVKVCKVYKDLLVKTFLYVNKSMAKRVVGGRIVDALQKKLLRIEQQAGVCEVSPEIAEISTDNGNKSVNAVHIVKSPQSQPTRDETSTETTQLDRKQEVSAESTQLDRKQETSTETTQLDRKQEDTSLEVSQSQKTKSEPSAESSLEETAENTERNSNELLDAQAPTVVDDVTDSVTTNQQDVVTADHEGKSVANTMNGISNNDATEDGEINKSVSVQIQHGTTSRSNSNETLEQHEDSSSRQKGMSGTKLHPIPSDVNCNTAHSPSPVLNPRNFNVIWYNSIKDKRKHEPQFIKDNPDLFEWNYFYDDNDEQTSLQHVLESDENSCMNWLATKETFFLTFVEMFVVHVQLVSTQPIYWSVLPAYDIMLKSFWGLLRSAVWWDGICKRVQGEGEGWVTSFPAYMRVKRTAIALLKNTDLLNSFLRMTYECTNLHSLLSVDSCVEHLNLWMTVVAEPEVSPKQVRQQRLNQAPPTGPGNNTKNSKMCLPQSFDYDLFWFGMKQLLGSHLFQALLKVCSFLYNNYHLFRGDNRVLLTNNILSNYFFPLFLHWSSEVRTYFQHTIVYKMLRADRRYLPCFTDTQVMNTFGGAPDNSKSLKAQDKDRQSHRTRERRLGVLDVADVGNNDELLIDIAICSKIDSYIRMCLDEDQLIPSELKVYLQPALTQYAELLKKYYRGVQLNSLESLPSLTHRMVLSDSNPYTH